MSKPALSVVIPTRDRADRLEETLDALSRQDVDELEVIVVDDGSTDRTPELLGRDVDRPYELVTRRQEPSGPARARNRGVGLSRAPRVLFLGDDTRPAPGCLRRHLAHPDVGVQGRIDWDPEQPVTAVMRFLAPSGPQFFFDGLRDGRPVSFAAVLGSNYSAPTGWLRDEPYDEGFPHAAVEDTELAWRFQKHGWTSIHDPTAIAWHHHHYETLGPFLARQRRAGRSARHAVRRHPRLVWPLVLEPTLFAPVVATRWLRGGSGGRGRREEGWDLQCRLAFLRGFLGG